MEDVVGGSCVCQSCQMFYRDYLITSCDTQEKEIESLKDQVSHLEIQVFQLQAECGDLDAVCYEREGYRQELDAIAKGANAVLEAYQQDIQPLQFKSDTDLPTKNGAPGLGAEGALID